MTFKSGKTERYINDISVMSKERHCQEEVSDEINNEKIYGHKININHLIEICSLKLSSNPKHKKALYIRASSYMKKKMYKDAI